MIGEEKRPAISLSQVSRGRNLFPRNFRLHLIHLAQYAGHSTEACPVRSFPVSCLSRTLSVPLGSPPANHGTSQFPNVRSPPLSRQSSFSRRE